MGTNAKLKRDFGALEKTVRWLEETEPAKFQAELPKKVGKAKGAKLEPFLKSALLAGVRSTQVLPEPGAPLPHGWLIQPSAQSLITQLEAGGLAADQEAARAALFVALSEVNREIRTQPGGPVKLPDHGPGTGAKEEIFFAFLEEVRAGNPDGADERFCWLVSDLEKGPLTDLILSAGLEGVTGDVHKVVAAVEAVSMLQWIGWEWAPLILRPVVRLQASGVHALDEYDRGLQEVAGQELLRLARRRPPGQPALGERDAGGFLARALEWAEAEPHDRLRLVSENLRAGVPLEDTGEVLGVGATLLFLQESLREVTHRVTAREADERMHVLTGVLALTRLVRLGTPGQRILALLLAGYLPGIRARQLAPRAPDSGWWLTPLQRLVETGSGPAEPPAAWGEAILSGKPTGLLPIIAEILDSGRTIERLAEEPSRSAPTRPVAAGLAIKLERSLADAYRTTRCPHRWIHLWASALSLSLWPEET